MCKSSTGGQIFFWFYTHISELFLEPPSFKMALRAILVQLHLRNLQRLPGEFLGVKKEKGTGILDYFNPLFRSMVISLFS